MSLSVPDWRAAVIQMPYRPKRELEAGRKTQIISQSMIGSWNGRQKLFNMLSMSTAKHLRMAMQVPPWHAQTWRRKSLFLDHASYHHRISMLWDVKQHQKSYPTLPIWSRWPSSIRSIIWGCRNVHSVIQRRYFGMVGHPLELDKSMAYGKKSELWATNFVAKNARPNTEKAALMRMKRSRFASPQQAKYFGKNGNTGESLVSYSLWLKYYIP